jgi:hypothetical protein
MNIYIQNNVVLQLFILLLLTNNNFKFYGEFGETGDRLSFGEKDSDGKTVDEGKDDLLSSITREVRDLCGKAGNNVDLTGDLDAATCIDGLDSLSLAFSLKVTIGTFPLKEAEPKIGSFSLWLRVRERNKIESLTANTFAGEDCGRVTSEVVFISEISSFASDGIVAAASLIAISSALALTKKKISPLIKLFGAYQIDLFQLDNSALVAFQCRRDVPEARADSAYVAALVESSNP